MLGVNTAMNIAIADNTSKSLLSILLPAIEMSEETRIAVAFMSKKGLDAIHGAIDSSLKKGGYAEFLVGLDLSETEPEALSFINQQRKREENIRLYCYADLAPAAIYHPKMYLSSAGLQTVAVVGSSNLTLGGLKNNVEVNAVMEVSADEEILADLHNAYNRLKYHPKRVEPDEDFLDLYQELCRRKKALKNVSEKDKAFKDLMIAFHVRSKGLRRPKPSPKDLFGWSKLVFSKLPGGTFDNDFVYSFAADFQKEYPENRNIRAKIRQQLQVLRDLNLIEHLGAGKWKRTGA